MYTYVDCNQPTYFDVDDTLIMWSVEDGENTIKLNGVSVVINEANINALKKHAMRGHTIIVCSAGGASWAKAVVDALGLQDLVDVIMEKPMWYYDDLPANAFMGKPHYYPYEGGDPDNAA